MNITKIFSVTLLCLGLAAGAQAGDVVSQAYEVSLDNFRAPATVNGGVSFRKCDSCDRQVVRVTGNTRYNINGKAVRLEDFRKSLAGANDRDAVTVIVLHHLESDTIAMVSATL